MKLYNLKGKKLNSIGVNPFALEKEIQDVVEANLTELFNLELVRSEIRIGGFRFDSLCFDQENHSFVIIEYKKGTNYSVIDQGYTYMSTLLNNKADFILEYNEVKGKSLKRDQIDWSQSRIIFVSPKFSDYQKNSINFKNVPFELWEIARYEIGLVSLSRHATTSTESIESIAPTQVEGSALKAVSQETKVFTEDDHIHQPKVKAEVKELYAELRARILELGPDMEVVPRKTYIGFKRRTNVIDISFLSGHLWCWLNLKKGELDDPKGLCRDVSKIGHAGNGDYDISVSRDTDLDYLMFLIKQSYTKQGR